MTNITQEPALHHYPLAHRAGKKMAYWQWGEPKASRLVFCVHGLTRQGRDFDVLAQAILKKADAMGQAVRVVCVDVLGRGQSDWLDDAAGYSYPQYIQDMASFLSHLHQTQPYQTWDWIGTSMGGLIGLGVLGSYGMGALPLAVAAQHFVINDVGPVLEWPALERIASYVGRHAPNVGLFATQQEAAQVMWQLASSFGPHTEAQWLALSQHQLKCCTDGRYTFAYDPAIAHIFKALTPEINTQGQQLAWQLYEHLMTKTLITRGLESDLLSQATAQAMTQRGCKMPQPAHLLEFAGVGHAPTFVAKEQHDLVIDFLWDV